MSKQELETIAQSMVAKGKSLYIRGMAITMASRN